MLSFFVKFGEIRRKLCAGRDCAYKQDKRTAEKSLFIAFSGHITGQNPLSLTVNGTADRVKFNRKRRKCPENMRSLAVKGVISIV